MPSRVVIVVCERFETLDAFGPLEVFAGAARLQPRDGYRVQLASAGGGPRRSESGILVETNDLLRLRPHPSDTVLVAGAQLEPILAAAKDPDIMDNADLTDFPIVVNDADILRQTMERNRRVLKRLLG